MTKVVFPAGSRINIRNTTSRTQGVSLTAGERALVRFNLIPGHCFQAEFDFATSLEVTEALGDLVGVPE